MGFCHAYHSHVDHLSASIQPLETSRAVEITAAKTETCMGDTDTDRANPNHNTAA